VRDVVGDPEIEMRAAISHQRTSAQGKSPNTNAPASTWSSGKRWRDNHLVPPAPGPNSGEPMSMRFVTRVSLGNPSIWIVVLVLIGSPANSSAYG
jgi:hypothetical protein